jgi:quercetin dioxygenase-like cupin family protein
MEIINGPSAIDACGDGPKMIQEFIGPVNTGHSNISIARMKSNQGWEEPGQTPDFDEYTVVLKGTLCVKTRQGSYKIKQGQAIIAPKGEWVQYSTPYAGGAEYIAVCLPAFTPATVHRDTEFRRGAKSNGL